MHLSRIVIFPIKSLDGVSISSARITSGGILEYDRVYAMMDSDGKAVNGKRHARVHQLRSEYDPEFKEVRLWENGGSASQFRLAEAAPIEKWLADFFGFPIAFKHDDQRGFPDDRDAFGPTILSEGSLRRVQEWHPEVLLPSVRRRFRANLELDGEPFCEDRLYGRAGELTPFQLGAVKFFGHNPCQRCVVPTRDPDGAGAIPDFQKKFMQHREETLPAWANAERFDHFYRFAVNTSIPPSEAGKHLQIGDQLVTA